MSNYIRHIIKFFSSHEVSEELTSKARQRIVQVMSPNKAHSTTIKTVVKTVIIHGAIRISLGKCSLKV